MLKKVMETLSFSRFAGRRQEEPATARMSAERVHKFSSQYGGENSRGYTASNLAGESYRYPSYGDFTEACVMRTYGPWWNKAPSAPTRIGCKNESFLAEDFVDLYYPNAVNPERIDIYETYNPGAVVRILACNKAPHESYIEGDQVCWEVLWSGPPQRVAPEARLFSPPLKCPSFPTRLIRIELNQSLCDYYTELDAVYLTGTNSEKDIVLQNSIESALDYLDIGKLSINDSTASTSRGDSNFDSQPPVEERECCGIFQSIPDEIISYILRFLTFKDLASLAQCCKYFKFLCYDPVFYKELNLKPYWSRISNRSLEGLLCRCSQTEKLDMSWLGPLGSISSSVFKKFISNCGTHLTHLRLSACEFVNMDLITTVVNVCTDLVELSLSSCDLEKPEGLSCLKNLKDLRILNLYRIPVPDSILTEIFRNCTNLEVLNLGSNITIENGNALMECLAAHCKKLRCLDLWRCKTLDSRGIEALAESCTCIEELDFGWCSNIKSNGQSIVAVAQKLPRLKKLFLTAVRSIDNADIEALSKYSMHLEQLDILGTGYVNTNPVFSLLQQCKNMKMLDVSFCSCIDFETVKTWRRTFSNVSIKKSFTV